MQIIKANGSREEFSEEKVLASIQRAGVPSDLQNEVLEHIKAALYEDIPTSEIYKHIQEYLGKTKVEYKQKYSLKQAIMEMGPSGHPFEKFIAEIFKAMGYETQVGVVLEGESIKHEVDIIATKGNEKVFTECKFHNRPGSISEVQVALYTKARYDDLKDKHGFTGAMLATNTKVSVDALEYLKRKDIGVMSWAYPEGASLRDMVEAYKLYPVTALSNLTLAQKQELLSKDIILIKQIAENPEILNQAFLPSEKKREVIEMARSIYSN
ncbi:MAG: hypothetical protein E6Q89_00480 [Bacteroidia bacterium]|nr:MAG: hypothetical protein E6Q89_00480 [Bacteroidia bacterium]